VSTPTLPVIPDQVRVQLSRPVPPESGFTNAVQRYYDVQPNSGSGYSVTVRLHYRDSELNGNTASALDLWRYDHGWIRPTATGRVTAAEPNNYVEKTGVAQLSPWAISENGPAVAPTAVTVSEFDARTWMAEQSVSGPLLALLGGFGAAVVLAWTWQRKRPAEKP